MVEIHYTIMNFICESFLFVKVSDFLSSNRVAVLDKVTDFLLFLGKLLIVGLVGESVNVTCTVFSDFFAEHE